MKNSLSLYLLGLLLAGCSLEESSQQPVGSPPEAGSDVSEAPPPLPPLPPVPSARAPREFSLVAYNVENLFDVDGVALFDDYRLDQPGNPFTYTRRKFLTKLENAVKVMDALESGGPDVILIQELENDFTPQSAVEDIDAFLEAHEDTTVRAMLTRAWQPEYAGYPAVAWLAKAMADAGLTGYQVSVAPKKDLESGIAHVNALFSRFPIVRVSYHPTPQARDIMEAELDVEGHSLWVYNNHWKSGASSPEREPIRVENARALRRLVDARLEENPRADIIIGGDLNSHYNHSLLFPDIETGINSVLEAGYKEGDDFYNLWYEIAPPLRYTEVWRGNRGTLMHLIVSEGLYDEEGVSYVDSSLKVGIFPGLNADEMLRPLEWNNAGQRGGGTSDHFPLIARFSTAVFEANQVLNDENDALDYELRHDSDPAVLPGKLPDGRFLNDPFDQDPGEIVGRLLDVSAVVINENPLRISVDGKEWDAYAPAPQVRNLLKKGVEKNLIVSYGYWKGSPQLVVAAVRAE